MNNSSQKTLFFRTTPILFTENEYYLFLLHKSKKYLRYMYNYSTIEKTF